MVDLRSPATFGVKDKNPKKEQLLKDRLSEIEKDNRLLFQRMRSIIVRDKPQHLRGSSLTSSVPIATQTLHGQKRKRDLARIT